MIKKRFHSVNHSFLNRHNQRCISLLSSESKLLLWQTKTYSKIEIVRVCVCDIPIENDQSIFTEQILTSLAGVFISAPFSISALTRLLFPMPIARSTEVIPSYSINICNKVEIRREVFADIKKNLIMKLLYPWIKPNILFSSLFIHLILSTALSPMIK